MPILVFSIEIGFGNQRRPCADDRHVSSLCQVRNNFGHKKRASDYSETLFISPFPQTKHIFFLFHIQLYIHYLRNFSSIFLSLSSNGIRFSYTTGSKRISFCNLCIAKSKSSSFATSSCFTSSSISSRLLNI